MSQTIADPATLATTTRRRRFARRAVALGVVAAALATVAFLAAAFGLVGGDVVSDVGRVVLLGVGLAPLVVGAVLARTPGTPRRRGFGLGLALGWVLWVVLVGGTLLIGLLILLSRMFTFQLNGVGFA